MPPFLLSAFWNPYLTSVKSFLTTMEKIILFLVLLALNRTIPLILITFYHALFFFRTHRYYCPIKRINPRRARNMPDTFLSYYRVSAQLPCEQWCFGDWCSVMVTNAISNITQTWTLVLVLPLCSCVTLGNYPTAVSVNFLICERPKIYP